ncbi:MAG TPA: CoA pyrophosphatase [Candidatus Dormibacteraeota bacterium]|nr:CoA pyrophosphatase [Candidatus Dormibacteraeota bacterium]
MDRILRAGDRWEEGIADALRRVARPIDADPRFAPRDVAGQTNVPRYDRDAFPRARPASTLLLLYPGADGELTVPLTVRHAEMRAHAGEVSLPGGAVDAADASREETALREAWEEIGVAPATVRLLGALDDIWIPVSNFELRPFVGVVGARPSLTPHTDEVAAIVELPVRHLLSDGVVSDELIEGPGWRLRAGVYRFGGQRIWGATARTLAMFATVLRDAVAADEA